MKKKNMCMWKRIIQFANRNNVGENLSEALPIEYISGIRYILYLYLYQTAGYCWEKIHKHSDRSHFDNHRS